MCIIGYCASSYMYMRKSVMITECWTPQNNHRDTFFSIYTYIVYMYLVIIHVYLILHNIIDYTVHIVLFAIISCQQMDCYL